jgi:hypothetical protein
MFENEELYEIDDIEAVMERYELDSRYFSYHVFRKTTDRCRLRNEHDFTFMKNMEFEGLWDVADQDELFRYWRRVEFDENVVKSHRGI